MERRIGFVGIILEGHDGVEAVNHVLSEHAESLDIKKNSGIIENVIYFGMNRKTEEILDNKKGNEKGNVNESI